MPEPLSPRAFATQAAFVEGWNAADGTDCPYARNSGGVFYRAWMKGYNLARVGLRVKLKMQPPAGRKRKAVA